MVLLAAIQTEQAVQPPIYWLGIPGAQGLALLGFLTCEAAL